MLRWKKDNHSCRKPRLQGLVIVLMQAVLKVYSVTEIRVLKKLTKCKKLLTAHPLQYIFIATGRSVKLRMLLLSDENFCAIFFQHDLIWIIRLETRLINRFSSRMQSVELVADIAFKVFLGMEYFVTWRMRLLYEPKLYKGKVFVFGCFFLLWANL